MMEAEPSAQSAPASKRGVAIAVAVLAVVICAAFIAYQALLGSAQSPESGESSPSTATTSGPDALWLADFDATVYSELGDATPLTKISDGKPLVINFWATWCPYCIEEMGDFQVIYDEYSDRVSFAFVDATDGTRETIEDAKAWVDDHAYTLPFYYDIKREAVSAFGITAFPTTVVVSADGEILTISAGRIDAGLMRSALDSIL